MSKKIRVDSETGNTVYLARFNESGQVGLSDGSSFENWGADGHDADDYDVSMSEVGTGGGKFVVDFDSGGSPAAGFYTVKAFIQLGANPADGDDVIGSSPEFGWDGSNIRRLSIDSDGRVDTDVAVIADAVCDEALAGHTTAGTLGKAISDIPSGIGTVAVDHNFGGNDALRYIDGAGSGIDNADILIYLKTDYDAGNLAAGYVKAKTNTDVNGRWASPCYLDPATYTIQVYKQGEFGPDSQEITVT